MVAMGEFQVTDAEVVVPSADFSDARVPTLPAALFQFVAGLYPADSVAAIADVPAPESPGGIPPTKSILMIMGTIAASAATPPVPPLPPVPPVPAPSAPPAARSVGRLISAGTSLPPSRGKAVSAKVPTSVATVPPVPTTVVPPIPPVAAPPVAIPPIAWSAGGLPSAENGTSTPPSPGDPAMAPASEATLPAIPPVAIPPTVVPAVATLPPAPPLAASGPAANAPALPPAAASETAPALASPAPLIRSHGGVRFTQATNRSVAATTGKTGVNRRDKSILVQMCPSTGNPLSIFRALRRLS